MRNVRFTALLFVAIIVSISCEKFRTEEYHMKDVDTRACAYLADSLTDTIYVKPLTYFDTSWVTPHIYDNVAKIIDTLKAHNIEVEPSIGYTIITEEDVDTNYIVYRNTHAGEVIIFINDYLNVNIVSEDSIIKEKSRAIPLETVAGCPEIKTRLVYVLEEDEYLLEFIKTDQTLSDTFNTVILWEEAR